MDSGIYFFTGIYFFKSATTFALIVKNYIIPSDNRELQLPAVCPERCQNYIIPSDNRELQP